MGIIAAHVGFQGQDMRVLKTSEHGSFLGEPHRRFSRAIATLKPEALPRAALTAQIYWLV
jgi:hypothetical protein